FTDYKVQGRSLQRVLVDLSNCKTLQSAYVMLSRAKSLAGVVIIRWFSPHKVQKPLSDEFEREFARLKALDVETS
ncbi:hypothetical protein SERLA73DRAFT_27735, partial [Serpula lacrymans var. lacrymans S7.3]